MNCYHIIDTKKEGSVELENGTFIIQAECNAEQEKQVLLAVASWSICLDWRWSCYADNDNGVDDSQEGTTIKELEPSNVVLDGSYAVGYYLSSPNGCLYFAEYRQESSPYLHTVEEDHTGGWGEAFTSHTYRLTVAKGAVYDPLIWRADEISAQSLVALGDGTLIKAYRYSELPELCSVIIPEGVTFIGEKAFSGCPRLQSVQFPTTLQTIDKSAFEGCISLEKVILHEGLQQVKQYAFKGCSRLTEIVLPDSVSLVADNALDGCCALEKVVFPGHVSPVSVWGWNDALGCVTRRCRRFEKTDGKKLSLGCIAFKCCNHQCTHEEEKEIEKVLKTWRLTKTSKYRTSDYVTKKELSYREETEEITLNPINIILYNSKAIGYEYSHRAVILFDQYEMDPPYIEGHRSYYTGTIYRRDFNHDEHHRFTLSLKEGADYSASEWASGLEVDRSPLGL